MKEKCVYCDYSGFEECKDLAFTKIDLNKLEIRASAWLSCNRTDVANGDQPKLMMDTSLLSLDDEVVVEADSIPIRYCPVCGRDLMADMPSELHELSDYVDSGYFSTRSYNALRRNGIKYVEDLELFTEKTVKNFKELGKKGFEYLLKFMELHDLNFGEVNVVDDILDKLSKGDSFSFTNSDGMFIRENYYAGKYERAWSWYDIYVFSDVDSDRMTRISLTLREASTIKKVS